MSWKCAQGSFCSLELFYLSMECNDTNIDLRLKYRQLRSFPIKDFSILKESCILSQYRWLNCILRTQIRLLWQHICSFKGWTKLIILRCQKLRSNSKHWFSSSYEWVCPHESASPWYCRKRFHGFFCKAPIQFSFHTSVSSWKSGMHRKSLFVPTKMSFYLLLFWALFQFVEQKASSQFPLSQISLGSRWAFPKACPLTRDTFRNRSSHWTSI